MLPWYEIWIWTTLGSISGMLRDPVTIAFMVGCAALGLSRVRWYWLALAIEVIVVANLLVTGSWLQGAGIDPITRIPWWLQNWSILALIAYLLGRALNSTIRVNRAAKKHQ